MEPFLPLLPEYLDAPKEVDVVEERKVPQRFESSLSCMDTREIPDEFEEDDIDISRVSRSMEPKSKKCETRKVRYIFPE